MISFEDIDKHSWWYDFYMKYLCAAHNHVYYRNFYIVNRENIPPKGTPTFVHAAMFEMAFIALSMVSWEASSEEAAVCSNSSASSRET